MPVFSMDLDTSVDDNIRRNYNPDKLEEDMNLPALPRVLNGNVKQSKPPASTEINELPQIQKSQITTQNANSHTEQKYCAIIRKGTKIKVRSLNNISDHSKKGYRVSFVSLYPVSTTYLTIPSGTVFRGEVVKTHRPELSANGGLIILKINSMTLNNEVQPIEAHVTKADNKLVFFNNIKGRRKFFNSMVQSTKNGRHFFTKMMRVTGNLATDGSSIFVAPFSIALGVLTLGANILISPALALLHKGGPISINAGSEFELKLIQDLYIYN